MVTHHRHGKHSMRSMYGRPWGLWYERQASCSTASIMEENVLYDVLKDPKSVGVFAKRVLHAGTTIISEDCLLAFFNPMGHHYTGKNPPEIRTAPLEIYRGFCDMSKWRQQAYGLLEYSESFNLEECAAQIVSANNSAEAAERIHNLNSLDAAKIVAVYRFNAIPNPMLCVRPEMGVFCQISAIGHSCVPNAVMSIDENNCGIVRIAKQIQEHDEITISLADFFMTRAERRERLKNRYGFVCNCPACDTSTDFGRRSAVRRERLIDLKAEADEAEAKPDAEVTKHELFDLAQVYIEMKTLMAQEEWCGKEWAQV